MPQFLAVRPSDGTPMETRAALSPQLPFVSRRRAAIRGQPNPDRCPKATSAPPWGAANAQRLRGAVRDGEKRAPIFAALRFVFPPPLK